MEEIYAFWDLIAQEAYLPSTEKLRNNTWKCFVKNELKKHIWLFACNDVSRELIRLYRKTWDIVGVLDNAEVMWGKDFCGVKVYSPKKIIPNLSMNNDVVILSLRLNADVVYRQIVNMGFYNIYSFGVLLAEREPYCSFIEEIQNLIEKVPVSNTVLMESMNDFDGNTGALYDYLKAIASKHKFVWLCKSEESVSDSFAGADIRLFPGKSVEDLKKYIKIRATARWEIWECDPIRKVRSDQINVFLQHYGMGYKQVAHFYNSPSYVDYVLTTNEFVREMETKSITYAPSSKFIYGELPRNDVLSISGWDELSKLTSRNYKKVVMWAPTLRESRYYHRVDSDIYYPFGISLIYQESEMARLNEILEELDMLLIVKPHPRQKIDFWEKGYSNILYLDGEMVKRIHAYKLLTQVDALITDYSSIVFDYMLLDRPCAWVLEDREHYKIEYLMDDPYVYMPGEKIFKMGDLVRFLNDVADDKDPYCNERRKVCRRCNPPFKGQGSKYLAEVLGL